MVDFAGWSMPVQYGSIIDEHQATRNAVGLFDVSHMGRLEFNGAGALTFLDKLTTRRVSNTPAGKIRYTLMCQESGTILDDVLVYHLPFVDESASCSMVVNASNRAKIVSWIEQQLSQFDVGSVSFVDRTKESAMIAVQGPSANALVAQIAGVDPAELSYYSGTVTEIGNTRGLISRTGYTGEDGCELILPAEHAATTWQRLMDLGEGDGARAAGLGARDTLRLEAAMPLYGHELTEEINAAQTGLGFAISLKEREFVGKEAIVAARANPDLPKRIGIEMDGRRAAREHSQVFQGETLVGEVTSGTFSPTLQRPIAMAYVSPSAAAAGTELHVDVRGTRLASRVVDLPFYQRST